MKATFPVAACLDWLTATKNELTGPQTDAAFKLAGRFFSSTGTECARIRDYEGAEIAGYGSVLQRRSSEVMIVLPAQALQYCRNVLKYSEVQILKWLIDYKYHFTRIDCALDTPDPDVRPQLAKEHWDRNACTSASRFAYHIQPKTEKGEAPEGNGWTFYIGSPKSERMFRIYDKSKELDAKTGQKIPHLTRFELQSRHELADATARLIQSKGLDEIRKIFRGLLNFKTFKGREEVYKRENVEWWDRIVSDTVEFVGVQRDIATPQRTLKWLQSSGILRAIKLARRFGKWDQIERELDETVIPLEVLKKWAGTFEPHLQGAHETWQT